MAQSLNLEQSYQEQMDKTQELEMLLSIQKGLNDVKSNHVKSLESVIQEIKSRHKGI